MKKLLYSIMLGLPLMAAMTGCDKEEIIFDSELPQFETRSDAVLLEVIMPTTTSVDDKIFIVGDFNGGKDNAVADPVWQLEKARGNDVKWGIYLDPSTFVDGKTLADGFYFYNVAQGDERSLRNEEILRTDNPSLGSRTNLTVLRWAEYFNKPADPDEIVHDGYVIYVVDNSGYDEVTMYAWGDAEAFGGWPGIPVTGTVEKDGTVYKYFDTGEANSGLSLNLIFNNNGGGEQLGDYGVTLDKDYYLELTPDGVVEYDPEASIVHDGYAVFVVNKTGWADDELSMYMWGDVNDLNGGWPGMSPTGVQTINGVKYLYFDFGADNEGLGENLIFTNGTSQLGDFAFTIERDLYLELTTKAVEIDPDTYVGGSDEPVVPKNKFNIYVENKTSWATLAVYGWGAAEAFGGWPGQVSGTAATVTIRDHVFDVYEVEETDDVVNLIFNDNAGSQFDGPGIVINRDYYFTVTDTEATEIPVEQLIYNGALIVEDNTGWSELYVYAWGDKEYFGGWPGKAPDGQFNMNGKVYKYWNYAGQGETENLIFNNNGDSQFDGPTVTLDRDWFMVLSADGFSIGNPSMINSLKKQAK